MPDSIEFLSINEINALLKSIDDIRDHSIIALFLNTGIFLNELVDLKINNINGEKKILAITGSRKREVPLNDQAYEALAKWSKERIDCKSPAFFITTKGKVKDLSTRAVDKLIRKYAKQAGIKKRINAQVLRNTFAIRLFTEEISTEKASAILGISDPQWINRYIQAAKQPPVVPEIPEPEERKETEHVDTRPRLRKWLSRMFPVKPRTAKRITEIKGPILPNPEEVVFGRNGIIEDTKSALTKNQSVLLFGPLGIGKTHLLKHFTKLMGSNTLYISSPAPIKGMLAQICDKLNPDWRKQIKTRASTKDIVDYLINAKGNQPPLIIIDSLQNLRISDVDYFTAIFENFTILASTDDLKPKLKSVWWKFKQIEIKPLSKEAVMELIKYLTQNLSISDYQLLETRIIGLANGLPLAIVDMIHQVSHRPVVNRDAVREIYHEAGIKYRDWTYAIVVVWGLAIIFRFVALGTHSFEWYILAGIGMSFAMIFRFFLFKLR